MGRRIQERIEPHKGRKYGKWVMEQDQRDIRDMIVKAEVIARDWLGGAKDEDVLTLARVMTVHQLRARYRQEHDDDQ